MRRNTAKRAAMERQYTKQRREFLHSRPQCEFPQCQQPATQVHHRRGRVGALLLDEEHWTAICGPHHQYVTEHPRHAYELGLSERRVS